MAVETATKASNRLLLFKAEATLVLLGFKVERDVDAGVLIFQLDKAGAAMLAVDDEQWGHYLETNVVFDAEVANLKLFSDIVDVIFMHKCISTGLTHGGDEQVQVTICHPLDKRITKASIAEGAQNISKCLQDLTKLIQDKLANIQNHIVDLSMFEHLDISSFNPRMLGERKEFLYKTWNNYAQAALKLNESPTLANVEATISEIVACRDFEAKNEMLLAEIGDSVLQELRMHRKMLSSGEHNIQ
jgi:hypothetical protein